MGMQWMKTRVWKWGVIVSILHLYLQFILLPRMQIVIVEISRTNQKIYLKETKTYQVSVVKILERTDHRKAQIARSECPCVGRLNMCWQIAVLWCIVAVKVWSGLTQHSINGNKTPLWLWECPESLVIIGRTMYVETDSGGKRGNSDLVSESVRRAVASSSATCKGYYIFIKQIVVN